MNGKLKVGLKEMPAGDGMQAHGLAMVSLQGCIHRGFPHQSEVFHSLILGKGRTKVRRRSITRQVRELNDEIDNGKSN